MIHAGTLRKRPDHPLLPAIYQRAVIDAVVKLDPRLMIKNPVMFVVEAGSALTTLLWLQALTGNGEAPAGFIGAISAWLWFTVLFANFAEALAEGRGKAQAESLRKMRQDTMAKKLYLGLRDRERQGTDAPDYLDVSSSTLHKTDLFYVKAGDTIPVDGEVVEGIASVNESAITGESAPVIRESGGDRSAVTGGTVILSDWLIIRVSANAGRGVPRPHDQSRRRGKAAEDTERDCAQHPPYRADCSISRSLCNALGVLDLQR